MGEDLRGVIIAMKAKDQRENLSPSRGEAMEEEAQGGEPLLLSRWRRSAIGRGIIAVVIVFINITITITIPISFTRSTLLNPAVITT